MKTALIIEDNEDNMTLVARLLKKAGWATLWAETGKKGLKMLADCKPDFVVLDIQLPDIDGTEVLKKMRSSEEGKEVPIIVVTSYAMAGDREKFWRPAAMRIWKNQLTRVCLLRKFAVS